MKNICIFCGGDIKDKVVTVVKERQGKVIIIENVPAGVCAQCGEKEFNSEVAQKLQEILEQPKSVKIKEERKVPVADFSFV